MTGTVISPLAPAPLGATVEHANESKLTPKGRAYLILTIDGRPCPTPTYILGRHLSLFV